MTAFSAPLSVAEVRRALALLHISPRRENGQNFLIDPAVPRHVCAAAALHAGEAVLEIGPGLGGLTAALVGTGASVTGIELDRRLALFLERQFRGTALRVIAGDVFRTNLSELFSDRQYALVSNLPFNITSLVVRNFLTQKPRPNRAALIMQHEVAERLAAPPGEMSLLSVAAQLYAVVEIICPIMKASFWPAPEVDAALVKLVLTPERVSEAEAKAVFRLARIGFSSRRKHLARNLADGLQQSHDAMREAIVSLGLPPLARAQELSIDQWIRLSKLIVNLFDLKPRK